MEKGIDRINKRIELKETIDEKKTDENRQFKIGGIAIKEKETQGEGDMKEEASTPRTNTILGLCAICHLTLGNINSNFNQNISCSQGHTLCQRCIQHFTIQLDPGCILCHAQYQQSNVNLSQESDISLNSIKSRPKRSQVPQYQSDYQSKHHYQRAQEHTSINAEQSYVKSWNQNYSSATNNVEGNSLECYNDDSETSSDYERSKERSNVRKERKKDRGKTNQQYSQCNLFEKGNLYTSEVRVNGQITLECSRRPIRCPRIDCAINVAFSALTHHFIFDHPEVPILSVEPGIKSTLIVSFNALSSNSSRCLALLLVSGKLSDPAARVFNGNQMNPKFRNRLPLSVLAARLRCTNQFTSIDQINKTNDFHKKDVIIAWVAGLDIGNTKEKLLCSIQAIDKIDTEGLRSLTYTGPVNSLRTAQRPEDIFSTGDCIVLHEGLLSHITSDCATLNVNVTIH